MSARLLVVFSDLHCGSTVGLSHPNAKQRAGNGIGLNKLQEWLWANWVRVAGEVRDYCGDEHPLVLANGDLVEGNHHRTHEINALSVEEHAENAALCLQPYKNFARGWIFTAGTECHVGHIEDFIAQKVTGDDKAKAQDKALFEVHGCLIDAAHHMPTTSRAYLEASALSICMGNARVNYARCDQRVPKVFLRGHRHCGGHYSDGAGLFGVTGAWQFLTRHGNKVVTDSIPRPSVLVLDWRNVPRGALPTVREFYVTPAQEPIAAY